MNTVQLPRPFAGIVPPMVTPLLDQDQIDVAGTQRLVEHMIRGGVHGLFALGTTGEATSLSLSQRHQFVELVCDTVAGRLPVVIGITDTCLESALDLADQSFAAGAAAVVSAAPYYLPMTQDDLLCYIEMLAERLPLPLILYNMPSCTKTPFTLDTVRRLKQHTNIIGLKDSSGDLSYFAGAAALRQDDPNFTVLMGPEELLVRSLELGGCGGVNGGANLFPRLYVSMYEAAAAKQWEEAHRLQGIVQTVSSRLYRLTESGARVIQGIKGALAELGLCGGTVAAPFRSYSGATLEQVRTAVVELEALLRSSLVMFPGESARPRFGPGIAPR